ncbi:HFL183Cp [Eremothecium sinecaudum]|uniref:HFL183Cp n=1 Tax=Eremothecium sinecaudum TaxID=45286 RepID=A0A109UZP3_9SACH|nr:HFL183Cp [Eremothecium sinecaudum]AMD21673.1 HFL183Cp [Eremothecium sinecaudum]
MEDTINHLQPRPYYDPETFNVGYSAVFKPGSGVVDPHGFNMASKLSIVQQGNKKFGAAVSSGSVKLSELTTGLKSRLAGSRGDYTDGSKVVKSLENFELPDILNYKIWKSVCQRLFQELLKRYFQHLIQLPFDTARMLLQVGEFDDVPKIKSSRRRRNTETSNVSLEELRNEDETDEEVDYFPSVDPHSRTNRDNSPQRTSPSAGGPDNVSALVHPASLHTMDVLNGVMDMEGTKGVWRANNTSFIYDFLWESMNSWFTGFFAPILQVPDPHFIEIIHSPDVQKSVALTLSACIVTGLVLLPLDLIKTRLTITRVGDDQERSLRRLFRKWSWRDYIGKLPGELLVLNVAHSLVGKVFQELTHIGLHHYCQIDRYSTRITFQILEFFSSCAQLFLKLPVEALLRRCQVDFLLDKSSPFFVAPEDLIIKPRTYQNVFITLRDYSRLGELWRGWRIGLMCVVCGHGLNIIELQNTDSVEEEKF